MRDTIASEQNQVSARVNQRGDDQLLPLGRILPNGKEKAVMCFVGCDAYLHLNLGVLGSYNAICIDL